jgi:hypothetical protein
VCVRVCECLAQRIDLGQEGCEEETVRHASLLVHGKSNEASTHGSERGAARRRLAERVVSIAGELGGICTVDQ